MDGVYGSEPIVVFPIPRGLIHEEKDPHSLTPYANDIKKYVVGNDYMREFFSAEGFRSSVPPILEQCVRPMLYLKTASYCNLSYSPDSIKVPVVNYIDNEMQNQINQFAKILISKVEQKVNESIRDENKSIGFDRYKIEIPSLLAITLKSCTSKDDFLDKALALRNSKDVTRFRRKLAEHDEAVRRGDRAKSRQIWEDCDLALDGEKKVESLGINVMNMLDKLKPIILIAGPALGLTVDPHLGTYMSAVAGALGLSQKLVDYFKSRWIVFLHDIPKRVEQIKSINDEIERVFKQKLTNTDLMELGHLNEAYQKSIIQTR